ncbi:MAG: Ldh family oxidoreductase [Hyphomicrobiaceae bacterium]|nr:Ldh family oxidoreductase [Hyphomicrobiaceae bacterium]
MTASEIATTAAETSRFAVEDLNAYAAAVFMAAGLSPAHAAEVAENLIIADLRGIASHGVTRVPIYAERLKRGIVNARPVISVERGTGAAVVVDGDNGPGAVVGLAAMREAVSRAKVHGIGMSVARRSNHYGICTHYILKAIEAGCIGITATNTAPSMAVWGSREPAVGTNPIAFGMPAGKYPSYVLDIATSVVARGKIVEKSKRGEAIPPGWALDRDGRPTTDSVAAANGVVLPLAGPKGSGLAVIVDVLCGVLSGAAFGSLIGNLYNDFSNEQNIGHFFLAIDIAALRNPDDFARGMETMIEMLKGKAKAPGFEEILMPGEHEARLTETARKQGLQLPANVIADLVQTGMEFGVSFPLPADSLTGRSAAVTEL